MKIIYVASPYAGDIQKNTEFAKRACRHVTEQGHAFFAPHLLYPSLLCEYVPAERQLALDMGLVMLSACDELWCYGDRISQGMMSEITEAERLAIPIRRVMEQENVFVIGKVKGNKLAEAPAPVMDIGMV
jgi:hypothetical protein